MIRYFENPVITLEEVLPLYEAVGWTNYTESNNAERGIQKFSSYISSA